MLLKDHDRSDGGQLREDCRVDVILEDFRSLVLELVRLLLSDITSRDSV